MKLVKFTSILLFLIIVATVGCSGMSDSHRLIQEKEMFAISYHYLQRAKESETVSDWYMAKYFYQIAYQIDPENKDIQIKIAYLKKKIKTDSQYHFQQGFNFYQNGKVKKARQSLLAALRINPEHQEARMYLVELIQQPEFNTYQVNKKTDLKTLAQEFYNDPEKCFLIAYFNNLSDNASPAIGSTLLIPWAPIQKTAAPFDIEENLEKARIFMESKRFSQALAITSKIREQDPENLGATEIDNAVYHQIAQEFERFGKYTEALNTMLKVKSDIQLTNSYISHLRLLVKDEADKHYRLGVRYFVEEELEKAIQEWERTLAIDPTNEMAQKDIGNAKNLLEKLQQIQ
jgi:tetratricopeptide (TPR) repeat protein